MSSPTRVITVEKTNVVTEAVEKAGAVPEAGLAGLAGFSLQGLDVAAEVENAAVLVAVLAASKALRLDTQDKIYTARVAFTTSWLAAATVISYIYLQIRSVRLNAATAVNAAEDASASPSRRVTRRQTTQAAEVAATAAHDDKQLRALLKDQAKALLIVATLHAYLGKPGPLFMQTAVPLWRVLRSKLFRVYVLGRPATGALQRPWVDDGLGARVKKVVLGALRGRLASAWRGNAVA